LTSVRVQYGHVLNCPNRTICCYYCCLPYVIIISVGMVLC